MIRLCLIGGSVSGSPSAAMQNAALAACGIDGEYSLRSLQPAEIDAFVDRMRAGEYRGCNVTMPYKRVLAGRCDTLSADATIIGAVNTISADDGILHGDNTDAGGFALGLHAHGLMPGPDTTALVLGAGGAAAAVALTLARVPVRRLWIAARSDDAVRELHGRLGAMVEVRRLPWAAADVAGIAREAGLLVNATPLTLKDLPVDVHTLPASCTVADVRYRPRPVELVATARAAGLRVADGMEMLVQQGMLAFTRWTGAVAPVAEARAALLRALGE